MAENNSNCGSIGNELDHDDIKLGDYQNDGSSIIIISATAAMDIPDLDCSMRDGRAQVAAGERRERPPDAPDLLPEQIARCTGPSGLRGNI